MTHCLPIGDSKHDLLLASPIANDDIVVVDIVIKVPDSAWGRGSTNARNVHATSIGLVV